MNKYMRTILLGSFFILLFFNVSAQKYKTSSGEISFFSETPLENIEARNEEVFCAYDSATGGIYFKVKMKKFNFKKSLMQKHFNENYIESDKYPYSTFEGQVINHDEINHSKPGKYKATVMGKLTIHGVTQVVKEDGTFTISKNQIDGKTSFSVLLKDYDIKIPKAVIKNIAEEINIEVNVSMNKIKPNP